MRIVYVQQRGWARRQASRSSSTASTSTGWPAAARWSRRWRASLIVLS